MCRPTSENRASLGSLAATPTRASLPPPGFWGSLATLGIPWLRDRTLRTLPPTACGFLPTSLLLSGGWSCWRRAPCSGLVSPQLITSAATQFPNKVTFKGATCLFWGHKSTPSPAAGLVGPPQSSRLLLPPALCTSGLRHPTPSWWVYSPVSCQSSREPRDHILPSCASLLPRKLCAVSPPGAGNRLEDRREPGLPRAQLPPTRFQLISPSLSLSGRVAFSVFATCRHASLLASFFRASLLTWEGKKPMISPPKDTEGTAVLFFLTDQQ